MSVSDEESGFTLVELMVVIVILGLLATIVAINVLPALGKGNAAKAKTDIATLEQALEMYRLAQPQRYRQGGYVKRLPNDPWGHPYRYVYPGQHGAFDVFSYGADDKEGGEGENADIGNWQ